MTVSAQTIRAGTSAIERLSKPHVLPLFVAVVFAAFCAIQLFWARQDRIVEREANAAKDAAYIDALRRIARTQDRLAMKLGVTPDVQ